MLRNYLTATIIVTVLFLTQGCSWKNITYKDVLRNANTPCYDVVVSKGVPDKSIAKGIEKGVECKDRVTHLIRLLKKTSN